MEHALKLANVIEALREELDLAKQSGDNEETNAIRFNVNNIELEFQTVIKKEITPEATVKISFWVLDADVKAKALYSNVQTQKIKLTLNAVDTKNIDPKIGEPGNLLLSGDE